MAGNAPIDAAPMPVPPLIRPPNFLETASTNVLDATAAVVPADTNVAQQTEAAQQETVTASNTQTASDTQTATSTSTGDASAEIPTAQNSIATTNEQSPQPLKDNTMATSSGTTMGNSDSGGANKATSPSPTPSLRRNSSRDDTTSGGGSDFMDSSLVYACACKPVRKVSLMSASDYCLSPSAVIGNKCGNAAVGEKGECPLAGSQPCQDTGHVLANDSICAFDKRDETYKCVASKEDLYIQKNGKRKKASNSTAAPPSVGGSSGAASLESGDGLALRLVLLVASLAVGLVAIA